MIPILRRLPLFLVLLPVFFVFHGFVENCFFIRFSDCWPLLGIYLAATTLVFGVARLFLKDNARAAILAAFLMSFFFFFGAVHDFLRENHIFLHRYSVLLPCFVLLTVLLVVFLKKKRPIGRTVLFLNSLLLVYLLIDAGTLAWRTALSKRRAEADASFLPVPVNRCDTCAKPDIYFILFDEYSGNSTLKDVYHYDNGALDSFLLKGGFHIQKSSFSNYLNTPLSMASILNFSYLPAMHDVGPDEFADMIGAISRNRVAGYLYDRGYTIVNYSPFDLPGRPSLRDQPFIPAKTRLITNRTLLNYVVRDLQPWIAAHLGDPSLTAVDRVADIDRLNRQLYSLTMEESRKKAGRPRFIYTHLFMPHFPYFYDSLLDRRSPRDVATHADEDNLDYYLQYLPYTNARAEELLSTIKKNTLGKAVIIFMSDHGFRYYGDGKKSYRHLYNNQNAVYFPDGDYRMLYDSISAVNEFRVVFNKLFHQDLALLKDSTVYLHEKQ